MQTITTRYSGPTNTRGSRIITTTTGGTRRYFPVDSESRDPHVDAVRAICAELGWVGRFHNGALPGGAQIWVFDNGAGALDIFREKGDE